MRHFIILFTRVAVTLSCVMLLVFGSAANAADDTVRVKSAPVQVKSLKAKKSDAPCAAGTSLPGGGGNYSSGCCASPPPFPGLACCDTRDCGWFNCDSEMKKPGKKFRKSQ